MRFRDKSIFSIEALKRGYYLGKLNSELFKDSMIMGHNLEFFMDLKEEKSKKAARWGLISPIGEFFGELFSADTYRGFKYFIKNQKNHNLF